MNTTTTNATCEQGCPWPTRECGQCDPPPSYTAPLLILGGITAIAYALAGAGLILLARLAWHAARALTGG